jgi:TetR/AcrR family transcriptional regulator, repressor for neighboring sulfatase
VGWDGDVRLQKGRDVIDRGPSPSARSDRLDPAVTAKIIEAASSLFSQEGPSTVTLRWIARDAEVSYNAVVARWSTPDQVLAAVLDHLADRIDKAYADLGPSIVSVPEVDGVIGTIQQILARAILDGKHPAHLQRAFPMVDRILEAAVAHGSDERTARYRIFESYLLEWGWRLLGPHLLDVCGLGDEPPDRADDEIRALQRHLFALPPVKPH